MFRILGSLCLMALLASSTVAGNLYAPASCSEIERAGYPWCQGRWAQWQNPCDYIGYYVGGGAPGPKSRDRCPDEGTWGWDYQGRKLPRIVRLGWTNPPRRQGGEGSYQPDGPRITEAIHEHLHSNHAE
jgi:hypothetical protein